MDIELLSSLVRKLILESDEVAVPGLGTFATELVSASFSDRGYTINPPYRKLDFIPSEAPTGGEVPAIVRRISSVRKVEETQAAAELAECVKAIRAELEAERLAELPGLGKLRLTKEGEIFFVAAEDLNIYPEGFGLEPVSLKNKEAQEFAKEETESAAKTADLTRDEEETGETASKSADLTQNEGREDPIAGQETATPGRAAAPAAPTPATPAPKVRRRLPVAVRVILILVAVLLVGAVALRVLGAVAPDFIDRLLYSPEELEILRQSL